MLSIFVPKLQRKHWIIDGWMDGWKAPTTKLLGIMRRNTIYMPRRSFPGTVLVNNFRVLLVCLQHSPKYFIDWRYSSRMYSVASVGCTPQTHMQMRLVIFVASENTKMLRKNKRFIIEAL